MIPSVHSVSNTLELRSLLAILFYFHTGKAKLNSADIDLKIIPIKQFLNQYPEKHLRIIGHSASNGNLIGQHLALRRALSVQNARISQGIAPGQMQIVGITTPQKSADSHQPLWLSRYVEIKPVTPSKGK